MLIIANGAFKSGSTWLYNILRDVTGFTAPPPDYLNPDWKNPSLLPEKITLLLSALRPSDGFIVKNHFDKPEQRAALLKHPDVRVFDMTRDLRDVVVSAYYHVRRVEGYTGDFEAYYGSLGRKVVRDVSRYHALWARPSRQVYCASYEGLHADFEAEVARWLVFLNITVPAEKIAAIKQATSLHALRERYGEQDDPDPFFRKGVVGDFQNHMNTEMLADLAALKSRADWEYSRVGQAVTVVKRLLRKLK